MLFILLVGLAFGVAGFLVSLFLPAAVGGVVLGIAGACTLLGILCLKGAKDTHGASAIGAGLLGIFLLIAGIIFMIGSGLGLILNLC